MLVLALLAGATAFAVSAFVALGAPQVLRLRSPRVIAVVAVGYGIAALFIAGRPTGTGPLDAVLRVAVVVFSVYAARYAQREAVVISAAIAVVASNNSPLQWLAFVAAGLAVATMLGGIRTPLIKAITGGALATFALDLRSPHFNGGPSIAALAVLAPILYSGYRHAHRRTRKRLRRAAYVAGGVLGVGLALGALATID